MNEIKIWNFEDSDVRTLTIGNEPYFVGKDVATILGYTNPQKAVRDHVDDDDRTVNESFTVNGTAVTLINESGLYSLILGSKLPSAKRFKRWKIPWPSRISSWRNFALKPVTMMLC